MDLKNLFLFVTRYRWYILALYSVVALMCNIGWNTWGPVEGSARPVYGWGAGTISLLSDWGSFTFLIAVFPSSYILDRFGKHKRKLKIIFILFSQWFKCLLINLLDMVITYINKNLCVFSFEDGESIIEFYQKPQNLQKKNSSWKFLNSILSEFH